MLRRQFCVKPVFSPDTPIHSVPAPKSTAASKGKRVLLRNSLRLLQVLEGGHHRRHRQQRPARGHGQRWIRQHVFGQGERKRKGLSRGAKP